MNLEELEKRVTLMEDIQEIENLQRRYAYYFDLQRWQDIVDLFSDNAESVEIVDHGLFKGKEGVKKMYWDWIGQGGKPFREPWVPPVNTLLQVFISSASVTHSIFHKVEGRGVTPALSAYFHHSFLLGMLKLAFPLP